MMQLDNSVGTELAVQFEERSLTLFVTLQFFMILQGWLISVVRIKNKMGKIFFF